MPGHYGKKKPMKKTNSKKKKMDAKKNTPRVRRSGMVAGA